MPDPTQRFSDRVEDYVRYRPSYPAAALELLRERCGLRRSSVVADVGSGTGKLTELLLEQGAQVYAVEPNAEMRAAAERLLDGREGFTSVAGRAEATGLPVCSVDLVTAAQAFHWFDQAAARAELRRILRPEGWVALLWNDRSEASEASSGFAREYELFLRRHSVDYEAVNRQGKSDDRAIAAFFGSHERASFPNRQRLDFTGLLGRYRSSSYAFRPEDPRFRYAEAALRSLFERYARGGALVMELTTELVWGRV